MEIEIVGFYMLFSYSLSIPSIVTTPNNWPASNDVTHGCGPIAVANYFRLK